MLIRASTPAPALRPYIARYWSLVGSFDQAASISLLPDGGVHLLTNLGEGAESQHFGSVARAEGQYCVGAMLQADEQQLQGQQYLFGISFKPGAFCYFHRFEAMQRLTGRVQPFDQRLPDARRSVEHVAKSLDRFYLERLAVPREALVDVIADIEGRHGRVRLEALATRHATTGRQLERQFERQLGMTPKQFFDLTRFRHAQALLERAPGGHGLAQLALDAGYYDQAHLTRHFKRFTGKPPTRLILSDLSKSAHG